MTKFYAIAPNAYLDSIVNRNRFLVASFMPTYYNSAGLRTLLDNGIYEAEVCGEGQTVDPPTLADIAVNWRIEEVIAPDAWKDRTKTVLAFRKFVERFGNNFRDVMGVTQGTSMNCLEKCLKDLRDCSVELVGIPIWVNREFGRRARVALTMIAHRMNLDVHWLGLDWTAELVPVKMIVRSVDSSLAFSMAYHFFDDEHKFQKWLPPTTSRRPKNFFSFKYSQSLSRRFLDTQVTVGAAVGDSICLSRQ